MYDTDTKGLEYLARAGQGLSSGATMPLLIVALAGQGAAVEQLRMLQGVDLSASRPRIAPSLAGRRKGRLHRRLWPQRSGHCSPTRLASREVNLVVVQGPPDILDINIAQRLGQQRAGGPARKPLRGAPYPAA